MDTIVHIALITDNNYILPTAVCIQSILQNKNKDSVYDINILSDNIKSEYIDLFSKFSTENFYVKVLQIDNKYKNLYNKNDYVTNSAFIKFDIPFILKDFEKVLYIDTDTIILKDLSELYNNNLEDKYAGVVKDIGDLFYKRSEEIDIKDYFNSGVILYNAEKYRKEQINKTALKTYIDNGQSFICHDQDTLNIVFKNNILLLEPKYNFQQSITEYPIKKVLKYYNITSEALKQQNIAILHYTRLKPWKYTFVTFGNLWKKYFLNLNCYQTLNLKNGLYLKIYFWLRGHYNLRLVNKLLKKGKQNHEK